MPSPPLGPDSAVLAPRPADPPRCRRVARDEARDAGVGSSPLERQKRMLAERNMEDTTHLES